jgi:DNA primase catalytic subunit
VLESYARRHTGASKTSVTDDVGVIEKVELNAHPSTHKLQQDMPRTMQILDAGLRKDFGFKHILWVYSGRRGIHCWVCDERARKLTDEQRGAIANYFAVYKGQERGTPKIALHSKMMNHPFIESAYDMLLQHWNQVRFCDTDCHFSIVARIV